MASCQGLGPLGHLGVQAGIGPRQLPHKPVGFVELADKPVVDGEETGQHKDEEVQLGGVDIGKDFARRHGAGVGDEIHVAAQAVPGGHAEEKDIGAGRFADAGEHQAGQPAKYGMLPRMIWRRVPGISRRMQRRKRKRESRPRGRAEGSICRGARSG